MYSTLKLESKKFQTFNENKLSVPSKSSIKSIFENTSKYNKCIFDFDTTNQVFVNENIVNFSIKLFQSSKLPMFFTRERRKFSNETVPMTKE